MVLTGLSAIIASFFYFYASLLVWQRIRNDQILFQRNRLIRITLVAIGFHFFSFASILFQPQQIAFSLGIALSFISWSAVLMLLISNLTKNTEMLGTFIFPLATLTTLVPITDTTYTLLPYALGSHILLSVLAYSLLGLATGQAVLYATQEHRFRKKQLSNLLKAMPPLQVMEKVLIEFTVLGFVLLTLALFSGAYFVENLFAQHLVHKTFFALLAWLTYGVFLYGHFKLGWRGQKAAHYSIGAFSFLLLSYIGTQIIMTYLVVKA